MCGIAGFLAFSASCSSEDFEPWAAKMAQALIHRGPDSGGIWSDAAAGIALTHRRLAVLDLTPSGDQPMVSASGRFTIAFNGEIYNHNELRVEVERGAVTSGWRGHSDTETLLAAIELWGIEATLPRLTGMFAFALWDRQEHVLTLVRDRLGEKPLYYGWCSNTFLFGSELNALCAFPDWRGEIDRSALANYMRYGFVPLPHSIYFGIRKLIPGAVITISSSMLARTWPEIRAFWSARAVVEDCELTELSHDDAVDRLESLLVQSIRRQMVADVPVGSFLSGGVDSSIVSALMQANSSRPVRTFSIGFREAGYDEAVYAKAVAAHLGTAHTELYVTPATALEVIPRLPSIYDEPFGDSSGIPTHLVAQLAREQVTVTLSGDGGDELFGGYNRYLWGRSLWNSIGPLPVKLRRSLGWMMAVLPPAAWDRLGLLFPRGLRQPMLGDQMHKLASVIDVTSPEELHRRLVSQHREEASLVIGARETAIWADTETSLLGRNDFIERMMFHDLVGYLTDDILAKVDRASMAVGLETRLPMLDPSVVEFAWQLPLGMKIRNGQGKWLLRQVLYRHVPKGLIDRPKHGFSVPLDAWLRGPLRDWAEALLDESRLRSEGYLHVPMVRRKWQEHLSGRRNWQHWLWNVLMFQAWHEKVLAN